MVFPVIVIALLVPILASAKTPLMFVVESVTESLVMIPLNAADEVSSKLVAAAVASYTRSSAMMPVIVSVFAEMLAVVDGCVRA